MRRLSAKEIQKWFDFCGFLLFICFLGTRGHKTRRINGMFASLFSVFISTNSMRTRTFVSGSAESFFSCPKWKAKRIFQPQKQNEANVLKQHYDLRSISRLKKWESERNRNRLQQMLNQNEILFRFSLVERIHTQLCGEWTGKCKM